MKFDQTAFAEYLDAMWIHLFGNDSLTKIIIEISNSHRARRFFTIYLLKNRETFQYYYAMRKDLSIEYIFDTIIAALFHEREKMPAKQELINLLQINLDMAEQRVEGYPLKEFNKDLNAFLAYWRKRTCGLQYLHNSCE